MSHHYLQLTVYMDETDTHADQPLYEVIVRRLLHAKIAGATAIRGVMGYGSHSRIHGKHLLGVSDDRPIVVVAIDESAKIRAVLPEIQHLAQGGPVTVMPLEVVAGGALPDPHEPSPR